MWRLFTVLYLFALIVMPGFWCVPSSTTQVRTVHSGSHIHVGFFLNFQARNGIS